MPLLKPHEYQLKGIEFFLKNPESGLFWPPGLGKTIVTLSAFKIRKQKKQARKMLIVSSRRIIHRVWPNEIAKWNFPFRISIIHGGTRTERGVKIEKKLEALQEDADVYLITYDGLEWLLKQKKKLREQFDMLVVDESSKMRNTRSKRFKILRKMLDNFDYRHILTGSPAPNGLINLFGQMYVLDQGECLGRYITQFKNNYFYPSGYMGYDYKLQDGAEERIYKAISPHILRISRKVLDMPDLVEVFHIVEIPKEARKLYNEMEEEFISDYEGRHITAANAGVATDKLRQIANGGIYYHKEIPVDSNILEIKRVREAVHLHDEKTEALKELVEELQGSPLLVAYEFHHDLDRLQKAFPDAPYIGSGVSDKEADKILDEWNAGNIPVLFGHPDSVAHGLNLQEAGCDVAYYSLTWNLENYEQFFQRVWRQGQEHPEVRIHHIIAEDTIDEVIIEALERKDRTQQSLFNALEEIMVRKEENVVVPTDDDIRLLAADMLSNGVQRLPRYDAHDDDKERRDKNFIHAIEQGIGSSWPEATRTLFLKRINGKAPAKKVQDDIMLMREATMNAVLKIFKVEGTVEQPVLTDEEFVVRNVGFVNRKLNSTKEGDKMTTTKKSFKKSSTTPADSKTPAKKVASKKVAAKKAPAKKAVSKKVAAKKVASKKAAVKTKPSSRISMDTKVGIVKQFTSGVRADFTALLKKQMTVEALFKLAAKKGIPESKSRGYLNWLVKNDFIEKV